MASRRDPRQSGLPAVHEALRRYWDADAPTYDRSLDHAVHTPAQQAAWSAALSRLLPGPPARVLDIGAGTGFLSILLARLGYRVTALDLSAGMLEQLRRRADREQLPVEIVEGPAESPPAGPFAVVVERLVLWTLVDPRSALEAWRSVAPGGRLASFGGLWGGADPVEALRGRARDYLHRLRRDPPEHHAPYPAVAGFATAGRAHPDYVVETISQAGWRAPRLERLRDVEWAQALALPRLVRALGVTPEFVVTADDEAGTAS